MQTFYFRLNYLHCLKCPPFNSFQQYFDNKPIALESSFKRFENRGRDREYTVVDLEKDKKKKKRKRKRKRKGRSGNRAKVSRKVNAPRY